ncbi:MAG: hypothetical protein QOH57_4250 [Mycobacterium sp.]|nr:hypothetical protein [Mycobacterium sp.]
MVNTPEGPRTEAVAPSSSAPGARVDPNLANAFDFYVNTDDSRGYYFTTPSGKWNCAIFPHSTAGCQSAGGTQPLRITGAPDTVRTDDGQDVAPNAVEIGDGDAVFVRLDPPGFGPPAGAPPRLDFTRTLAAGGFRCNVQESGVSCQNEVSHKGFTFSPDGFTPEYTPVPG